MKIENIATLQPINRSASSVTKKGEDCIITRKLNNKEWHTYTDAKPKTIKYVGQENGNLIGKRFGRLDVIGYYGSSSNGARWVCQCACGKYVVRKGQVLRRGNMLLCDYCYTIEKMRRGTY